MSRSFNAGTWIYSNLINMISSDIVKRSTLDRRSGEDKRKTYNLDYFAEGGSERQRKIERRRHGERRSNWAPVGRWCSVYIGI